MLVELENTSLSIEINNILKKNLKLFLSKKYFNQYDEQRIT